MGVGIWPRLGMEKRVGRHEITNREVRELKGTCVCPSKLATDAEGKSTMGLLSLPCSPISILHQVPLPSAWIPELGHPARLLAPPLTLAQ